MQSLRLYAAEGLLAGNITRNSLNMLPNNAVDGPTYTLLASFPATGTGLCALIYQQNCTIHTDVCLLAACLLLLAETLRGRCGAVSG